MITVETNSKDGCKEVVIFQGTDDDHQGLSPEGKRTENGDDLERDNQTSKPKAPDGGYGWFVVLGCFICHMVLGGLDRSEGIFYLLVLSRFDQSAQLSAWPGAIATALLLMMGPVANAVANRYSARSSVMVGAALMLLGSIMNSVAPVFYSYFVSHALILGIGKGLAYAPGLIMVSKYFNKRAGLAAGLATSGAGIGTFVIVPLAQYLADNYGFLGTYLIMGGFSCNIFISAMLYRPLSQHYKYMQRSTDKQTFYNPDDPDKEETLQLHKYPATETHNENGSCALLSKSNEQCSCANSANQCLKHTSRMETKEIDKRNKCPCLISSIKICFPSEGKNQKATSLKTLFHFSLLKNPSFLVFCLSMFMFSTSFRAAFTFIPALVESKGISSSEAALTLSIAGAADTFGRMGTGFVLDQPKIRPYRLILYNLLIFGVAGVAFVLPFLKTFVSFCVMCGLFGFLTGAYISQKSVVLVDILDIQHMASSFGILIAFQGLGSLLGPPLSGALKDVLGTYDEIFYVGGGLLLVSGLTMVMSNILNVVFKGKGSS